MFKKICICLILIFSCSLSHAATYNYYFSDTGTSSTCLTDTDPCSSIATANSKVSAATVNDIVNLYFERGSIWYEDSALVSSTNTNYGFLFLENGPVVNVDAYGSGDKPIFDGQVTDFLNTSAHDATNGPVKWNRFFEFQHNGSSISNVEIKNVYGHAVFLRGGTGGYDNFLMTNCYIHNFGSSALSNAMDIGVINTTVSYSTIHTGQQLELYNKVNGWAAGITLSSTGTGAYYDNYVHHVTIYDIYGECISAPNSIIEYNIVGSCGSTALNMATQQMDHKGTIVRYNYVIMEDYDNTVYETLSGGERACVRVFDEHATGDNTPGKMVIHDNICINYDYGVRGFCSNDVDNECGNPFGDVEIYNNIFIDSDYNNIYFTYLTDVSQIMYIHDNISILYDRPGSIHASDSNEMPVAGWTIENNQFWTTGGSPVVDTAFQTGYITTDPEFINGDTINWIGQTGATYFATINPKTDINPPASSAAYGINAIAGMDIMDLGNQGGSGSCTTPPIWNTTVGIFNAVDQQDSDSVFTYANPASSACDSNPVVYNRYYNRTTLWNTDCADNILWSDAGETPWIITGLTDNVSYTFCVRAEDSLGNEDPNTVTFDATPTNGVINTRFVIGNHPTIH